MAIFSFHLTLRSTDSCCVLVLSSSLCFCPQRQQAEHSRGLHVAEGALCLQEKEREGGRRGWTGAGGLQVSVQVRRGGQGSSSSAVGRSRLSQHSVSSPQLPKDQNGWETRNLQGLGKSMRPSFLPACPCNSLPWQCQDALFSIGVVKDVGATIHHQLGPHACEILSVFSPMLDYFYWKTITFERHIAGENYCTIWWFWTSFIFMRMWRHIGWWKDRRIIYPLELYYLEKVFVFPL